MKKRICLLMTLCLLLALPAFSGSIRAKAESAQVGGWKIEESLEIDEKAQAVFEKATEGLLGVGYTPIQLLGTQLVSGTNYCFLSEAQVVYPGAEPGYALVYIYENLQGEAKVTNIVDLTLDEVLTLGEEDIAKFAQPEEPEAAEEPAAEAEPAPAEAEQVQVGGWSVTESLDIDEKALAAYEKAVAGSMLGEDCTPVQLLGTQLVSGTNYCFLSEAKAVNPGVLPQYELVYIYENLQGEASITNVVDLTLDEVLTLGEDDIAKFAQPEEPEAAEEPAAEAESEAVEEPAAEAEPEAAEEPAEKAEPEATEEPAAEAEPEAAEEPAEETEPVMEKLPEFEYTGEDPYFDAVWDFLRTVNLANFAPAQVMIPEFDILREDDSDPEDIKIWGHFWLTNYNLEGDTLMMQSCGDYPGLYHLLPLEEGYQVFCVEEIEDGENYSVTAEKIFGVDKDLLEAFYNSGEENQDYRIDAVRMYAEDTGLDIKAYQDFGWDPVPVAE